MILRLAVTVALLSSAVPTLACPGLEATEAWIRMSPPGVPQAGYARLTNTGPEALRIEAVASPAFGAVELHETRSVDGMLRMRPVSQLELGPRESRSLAPGGLHLMLFRPLQPAVEGEQVPITFRCGEAQRSLPFLIQR